MRLQGSVSNHNILILIDSGSSGTFVSDQLVHYLQLKIVPSPMVQVKMADGSKITSDSKVQSLSWWSQGHSFTIAPRVLPLGSYDLILGIDWLEEHSPMWVDWRRKKMRFTYQGTRITLNGVKDCTAKCPPLKIKKPKGLLRHGEVAQLVQLQKMGDQTQKHQLDPPTDIQELV
jgi:hypothetical protein